MTGSTVLDFIFGAIILISAIVAVIKGLFRELFEKGAPIVAIWISILFYKRLTVVFEKYIDKHVLAAILAFLAIFVVVFLVLKIIQLSLQKLFDTPLLNPLDHFLGFVFGIIEGLAIVGLILLIISVQPWFNLSKLLSGSFFYKLLTPFITRPLNINQSGTNELQALLFFKEVISNV